MPRATETPLGGVLRFFRSISLDAAEMAFGLVRDVIRARRQTETSQALTARSEASAADQIIAAGRALAPAAGAEKLAKAKKVKPAAAPTRKIADGPTAAALKRLKGRKRIPDSQLTPAQRAQRRRDEKKRERRRQEREAARRAAVKQAKADTKLGPRELGAGVPHDPTKRTKGGVPQRQRRRANGGAVAAGRAVTHDRRRVNETPADLPEPDGPIDSDLDFIEDEHDRRQTLGDPLFDH
jgi:hypothetical protein